MTSTFHLALQTLTLSTALFTAGGIAALSAFDIPLLRSQPASRSLPLLRWLFSRGSHAAPTGIFVSSAGFAALAYTALPPNPSPSSPSSIATLASLLRGRPGLFTLASLLCASTAVFTGAVMIPAANFELIALNEELGGAKSERSAEYREGVGAGPRSAVQSVNGERDVSQWTDGSGPMERTAREASEAQEERVGELLERFGRLNWVRAGLMGVGGVVGLVGALA